MYSGWLGMRHSEGDVNHLYAPQRERTPREESLMLELAKRDESMREFITKMTNDVDRRCKEMALIKLDELVMWLRRGIDG